MYDPALRLRRSEPVVSDSCSVKSLGFIHIQANPAVWSNPVFCTKGWRGQGRSGLYEEDFVLLEEFDEHVVPELVEASVHGEDGEGGAGGAKEAFAVEFAV